MPGRWLIAVLTLCAIPAVSVAGPDDEPVAVLLRGLLLKNLPDPLVESGHDWGRQKDVVVGLSWHKLKAEPRRAEKNDGHWEHLRIQGINPSNTLALGVRDLESREPGRTTFAAQLGLDVRLTYHHQIWKSGARLYSGETQARCRAILRLTCELTRRTEPRPGGVLPDVVLRVRVTAADVSYQDLVCEHTAGVGGDAARALGEAIRTVLKKLKPGLERQLLDKANAAIVSAADTKEVRVELDKLLSGKAPTLTHGKP